MEEEVIEKLQYTSDEAAGYTRRKHGTGFSYKDDEGKTIKDKAILERIKMLKIPPMWRHVWISKNKTGHLQATGKDSKDRKQYLYHPRWVAHRNASKFFKLGSFGQKLPEIREIVEKDLRRHGWPKAKVLALVVSLLDEAYIRIGNICYQRQNETYGLTTLRRKHLILESGKSLNLEYKGKSGQYRKVHIENEKLIKMVKACSELPGYEVFKFVNEKKKQECIDSSDVNQYIHAIAGANYSSKDFRTWGGSVLALELLPETISQIEENKRLSLIPTLVKNVAAVLGNTPAICREYYIHPAILSCIEDETLEEARKLVKRKKYVQLYDHMDEDEVLALAIIEDFEDEAKALEIEGMEA